MNVLDRENPARRLEDAVWGLILFTAAFPLSLWRAFVLSRLWDWFAVAGLNAPHLSVPLIAGLLVIKSLAFDRIRKTPDYTAKDYRLALCVGISGPAFALLFGWILASHLAR